MERKKRTCCVARSPVVPAAAGRGALQAEAGFRSTKL